MKVLFYGGCHAAALSRVFGRYSNSLERVDHLFNFDLIRKQAAVPYDYICSFDRVIFSPIRNKGDYNTSYLECFLKSQGIPFLKYPWLQWEGYFPGTVRSPYSWFVGWWPSSLESLVEKCNSKQEFLDSVYSGLALLDSISSNFERTTARLIAGERDCDIKISDMILSNYQSKRLFLTNDHAGLELYKYIVAEIAGWLCAFVDPAFYNSNTEVQRGIQLPILPSVSKALGIQFPGGDFLNKYMIGDGILSMTEYLGLIWSARSVFVAFSTCDTRIYSLSPNMQKGQAFQVRNGAQVLLMDTGAGRVGNHHNYKLVAFRRGSTKVLDKLAYSEVLLYKSHWLFQ